MVCFRKVKTKHVQQADNQVEGSGDTQIQQIHAQHAADYIERRRQLVNVEGRKLVYYSIQKELNYSAEHPVKSRLVNTRPILVVVGRAESLVVHHWEQRETNVWQHEEV